MRLPVTSILLLTTFRVFGNAAQADTTIQGINISFTYSASIFPASWNEPPVNAIGEKLPADEITRSKRIVSEALKKYPINVLRLNLKAVCFVRSLNFYGLTYGGTNSKDTVYLANRGDDQGYSDIYIEQTFHHEFSSILYRNFSSYFDETFWRKINAPGFDYNDPEEGNGAIRNNRSSQTIDIGLCAEGFLTEYSMSSLENDINTIAQNLFRPSRNFWKCVDQFPRISRKVDLLVAFYKKLNPVFTLSYFKSLNR